VFVWSFIGCFDLFTWGLEVMPVVIGVAILMLVYRRFRFTNLVYVLIWLHAIILLVGAHYTYARVPLFNWIRDAFELSRNHYDRLGHFVQGFVPALVAREVLLRQSPLQRGGWLFSTVVCFCLAVSAFYEIFEGIVGVLAQDDAAAFLATQGDVWDTQKDMALCLAGAVIALLTLGRLHDAALKKLEGER
jgi:putative membrane protein